MPEAQNVQSVNALLIEQRRALTQAVTAASAGVIERKAQTEYNLRLATIADRLVGFEWSWLMQLGTLQPQRVAFSEYLVTREMVLLDYDPDENLQAIQKALEDSEPLAAMLLEHGLDVKHRMVEPEGELPRYQVHIVRA